MVFSFFFSGESKWNSLPELLDFTLYTFWEDYFSDFWAINSGGEGSFWKFQEMKVYTMPISQPARALAWACALEGTQLEEVQATAGPVFPDGFLLRGHTTG